jgi:hypothetical protein
VCVPTSSATANGFGPAALQLDWLSGNVKVAQGHDPQVFFWY